MPFHPNILTPRCYITSSPHAQAGFAISQPANWNGPFCSTARRWSHERGYQAAHPPGWMAWSPRQLVAERNRAKAFTVIFCLCPGAWRVRAGWFPFVVQTKCSDLCGAAKHNRLSHKAWETIAGQRKHENKHCNRMSHKHWTKAFSIGWHRTLHSQASGASLLWRMNICWAM